jgi:ESCRT-I complex subunit TSG101
MFVFLYLYKKTGTLYRIPITVWLLDNFPKVAPTVYVSPTGNMRINNGRNVDRNGKVYHTYLYDWKEVK